MRQALFFTDTATETTRSYDDAGNLRLSAKVARVGDQHYLGREIGRKPANQKFAIKREEGEVFKDSFLDSLKDIPITMMSNGKHPPQFVNPSNRSKVPVVGHVTTRGSKDGDWVLVDCIIHDAKAIKAIEKDDQMLSLGYDAKAINDSVVDMVANHLSIVKNPRAGQSCKFQDNEEESNMEQPIRLKIGDCVFNVADESSAKELTELYDAMAEKLAESEEDKKKLKDMEKKKAESDAAKDKAEEKAKGYKDALDKIETSEAIKLADSFVKAQFTDCKSAIEVKRSALAQAKVFDKNWKDASEAQVEAYFDAAIEAKKEGSKKFADSVENMNQINDSSTNYDQYVKELKGEV